MSKNKTSQNAFSGKSNYLLLSLVSVLIMLINSLGVMAQEPTSTPSPQPVPIQRPWWWDNPIVVVPTLVPNGDQVIQSAGNLLPNDPGSYPYNRQMDNPNPENEKTDLVTCHFENREVGDIQEIKDKLNFNPSNPYIYPGSIIQGKSLLNGAFAPVTIPRNSGRINVTGINLGDVAMYRDVSVLDAPHVQAAINEILANPVEGQPANVVSDFTTASSKEELLLELGLDARYGGASISADFMKKSKHTNTVVVAKYIQIFYTVNVEPPTYSYSLFRDENHFDNINNQIAPGNPPLYINSVGYGRMLMLSAESEYDEGAIKATLKAGYDGGAASVKIRGNLTASDVMEKTKISYIIYGGSASEQIKVIDASKDAYQKFLAVITDSKLANYGPANPGLPIQYSVAYLKDRNPVAIAYAGTFRQQICSALPKHSVVFNFTQIHQNGAVIVRIDGEPILFLPGGEHYPGGWYPAKENEVENLFSYYVRMPDENGTKLVKTNIDNASAYPLDLEFVLDYLEKKNPGNKQHLVSITYDHYWCGRYSLNINVSVDKQNRDDLSQEMHSINGTGGPFNCSPLKTWEFAVDRTSDNPVTFLRRYDPN